MNRHANKLRAALYGGLMVLGMTPAVSNAVAPCSNCYLCCEQAGPYFRSWYCEGYIPGATYANSDWSKSVNINWLPSAAAAFDMRRLECRVNASASLSSYWTTYYADLPAPTGLVGITNYLDCYTI